MATLADDGLRVIDADTHFTEPYDLWTSRAPAAYKDRVLHIEQRPEGPSWVVDGVELGFAKGGGVVARDKSKIPFLDSMDKGHDWVHRGAWDPEARLQVMDECGIHAQVLFPNAVGLGGGNINNNVQDEKLRTAVHRDLQRRDGGAAGAVEPAVPPDAGHARVGRRPLRHGDERSRGAWARAAST